MEQMKQGRRRIADGDHGAVQMLAPQLQCCGAAGVAHVGGQRRHTRVLQGADDGVLSRQALARDALADHACIAEHGCSAPQRGFRRFGKGRGEMDM
jgi:hypothetical protein